MAIDPVIITLGLVVVAQQVSIQILINKVMSKSYDEYIYAKRRKYKDKKPVIPPQDPEEDLAVLGNLG